MKTLFIYLALLLVFPASMQELRVNPEQTQLTIFGTSSIHDWEIEANHSIGTAEVTFENGQFSSIEALTFKVEVASLESGKSAMDDNTVEALKGDKYPFITYKLKSVNSTKKVGEDSILWTTGDLTIAGVTRPINMEVQLEDNSGSLTITGEVNLKMTDFKVDPPTAIFGTITTGDAIKIQFKTNYIH